MIDNEPICLECGLERDGNDWYLCRQCNKKAQWKRHLKRSYDLSVEEYDEMVHRTGNKCYVCDRLGTHKKKLHVDHDHKTGKVRGMLCYGCNGAIGYIKENTETLDKLKAYLIQHS
jgi:hypothetical protein